jgi:hypothetical protein
LIEDHELRIDRDVAAIAGLAFDRGGDLAADERKSRTCKVMLPPLAVGVLASVEIAPPLLISRRLAETVIDPASPLPVDWAVICGPGSGSTMSAAAMPAPPAMRR